MDDRIKALVNDVGELVSIPEVAMRVNQMVDDPKSTAMDMGRVLAQDPALAVRLLRIANSPFYGLATEIDSISRAVTLLGTKQIRDLVVSTAVANAFDGIPNSLISMKDFWLHSLYCGLLAKTLAKVGGKVNGDSIFVSGLLHDIGQLVMFNRMPEESRQAIVLVMDGPDDLQMYQAERQIFGFDHMQVGAELAQSWQLSKTLQECIEFHHEPTRAKDFPLETAMIHIANTVAVIAELHETDYAEELASLDPVSWELTGLTMDDIGPAITSVHEEIAEIEKALFSDS
ncbi:MAG: HDOD domain-containing protein [Gammaproteobacteria bacterium]|nr:MAG: HDOD domain-containing protein [Gammaproteobacteria bacterium]